MHHPCPGTLLFTVSGVNDKYQQKDAHHLEWEIPVFPEFVATFLAVSEFCFLVLPIRLHACIAYLYN